VRTLAAIRTSGLRARHSSATMFAVCYGGWHVRLDVRGRVTRVVQSRDSVIRVEPRRRRERKYITEAPRSRRTLDSFDNMTASLVRCDETALPTRNDE
jgi:hypothetical protein